MRAVFFDLDGTLLHSTREYRELLGDAIDDVTGHVSPAVLEQYNETFFDNLHRCEPDPVEQAFEAALPDADPVALADDLLEREIEATEPPTGAAEDLARLANQFRLGVLTNGVREWQERKLRAHELEAFFDVIVASYEAGAHKPAAAPFRLAERRLSADAYAMVGDDAVDVEGAIDAGWTAHRYEGDGFDDLPGALHWNEPSTGSTAGTR